MKTYLTQNTSCNKRNHCLHIFWSRHMLWKPTACRRMYIFYNTYKLHSWHFTGMFRPLLHETFHFGNSQRPGMVVTRHTNPLQLLYTTAWNVLCKFYVSPTFPVYHINQSCATMHVLGASSTVTSMTIPVFPVSALKILPCSFAVPYFGLSISAVLPIYSLLTTPLRE